MLTVRSKLSLILLLLISTGIRAQYAGQGKVLDSLIKNLDNYPKPDTFRLNALFAVLDQSVRNAAPYKAEKYYPEAMQLARKFDNKLRISNVYHFLGRLYNTKKDHKAALLYLDSAMLIHQQVEDGPKKEAGFANLKMDIALTYSLMGDRNSQLKNLLDAFAIYEKIGHERSMWTAFNISNVYRDLYNTEKDLEYSLKAANIAEEQNSASLKISAYLNYANGLLEANDPAASQIWLAKAKPLIGPDDVYNSWMYYTYLGRSKQQQKNFAASEQDFKEALKYAEMAGHETFVHDVLAYLTFSMLQTDNWRESKAYLDRYLPLATKEKPSVTEREALRRMAEYYTRTGDFKLANYYGSKALAINDSFLIEKNAEQLNQLEARYQFDKKENEISQLQKDKQIQSLMLEKRSTFNYILIGITIVLLLVGFLLFRNYRNRQVLQAQKIRELEKDKQIAVTESILKGEEKERERLAKDLHDGLGGLLSGVKLSLSNMKSNVVISGENAETFQRSLDLIDTSIRELRRVAHNMMPEALMKSGLNTALNDYCKSINASTNIKVTYLGYGMERQLDNSVSLIIYRVIQELITNVLKHAEATELLVQVVLRDSSVSMTVEDNGKGFDISRLPASEGAGWKNIKSRVDYLKGTIDVKSEAGKGTSVNIEMKL
jgi:signal transduction histidine kinase